MSDAHRAPHTDDPPRALVLDANARHGLVAVRCLGRYGFRVTAGAERRLSAGGVSRHCDRRLRYPSPVDETEAFVETIEGELRRRDYDVLLPVHDATVVPVAKHRARLADHVGVPIQPHERLLVGLDKYRTVKAARAAGVPHPTTLAPDELDLDAVADELGYPVVVKPRRGSQRLGVTVCDSRDELERVVAETRDRHGPVLLQEYVPDGGELGVYTVYDCDTRLRGLTVQRRVRSNPPEGGPSTLRETVRDPELVRLADDLLSSVGWRGAAMVEFRVDARTDRPQLLEINPRLWGSLALTVHASVDVPVLLAQLAVDGDCESRTEYDVGVRARWLFGDLLQLLAREDRRTALGEFLRSTAAGCRYDVLSATDPLPAAAYGFSGLAGRLR